MVGQFESAAVEPNMEERARMPPTTRLEERAIVIVVEFWQSPLKKL